MQTVKKYIRQFKQLDLSTKLYVITAIVTAIFFSALAAGSVFLQKEMRQSQDLRKQGLTPDGAVSIQLYPDPAQPDVSFTTDTVQSIVFGISTTTRDVSAIQLQFLIEILDAQGNRITGNDPLVGGPLDNLRLEKIDTGHNLNIIHSSFQQFAPGQYLLRVFANTTDPTTGPKTAPIMADGGDYAQFVRLYFKPESSFNPAWLRVNLQDPNNLQNSYVLGAGGADRLRVMPEALYPIDDSLPSCSIPTNLTTSFTCDVNNSTATVTWDHIPEFGPNSDDSVDYNVHLVPYADPDQTYPIEIQTINNNNLATFTNLSEGESYYAQVYVSATNFCDPQQAGSNISMFTIDCDAPPPSCQDSDSGANYDVAGQTTGTLASYVPTDIAASCQQHADGTVTCQDYCFAWNQPTYGYQDGLTEWICDTDAQGNSEISYTRTTCPYGCYQGACLPEIQTPFCPLVENLHLEYLGCYQNADGYGEVQLAWNEPDWTGLGYTALPQNVDYEIDLSQDPNFNSGQIITVDDASYSTQTLDNGNWYARVRVSEAVDSSQDDVCIPPGPWSLITPFTVDCEPDQPQCQYIFQNDWSECINGWQTQSYQVIGENCPAPDWDAWHRRCNEQCQYQCGEWSECGPDHWQSRVCTAVNEPCWDYTGNNRGTSYVEERACDLDDIDFSTILFDSYEACWYGESEGASVYIAWLTDYYPNVTWVDISSESDFEYFAHKNVEDADTDDGYAITSGTGFVWSHNGDEFSFQPEDTYYARLYYQPEDSDDYIHSRIVSFRMHRCAGVGTVSYQQCNDECDADHDCASGLYCYQGRCRLPANPENEYCIDPDALSGCGEWCADSRECESGLTCWYNYCRNPNNIDITITDEYQISLELDKARATNCADWSQQDRLRYQYLYYTPDPQATTYYTTKGGQTVAAGDVVTTAGGTSVDVVGCNQYCSSNRQCEPNHRCYQNRCRLAINPESTTCSSVETGKGGQTDKADEDDQQQPAVSTSPTPAPEDGEADTDTNEKTADQPQSNQDRQASEQTDQNAWESLKQHFQERQLPLPLLIGAGIAGLILLIAIIALAAGDKKDDYYHPSDFTSLETDKPAQQNTASSDNMTPPPSSMINRMKEKGVKPPSPPNSN